MTNAQDHDPGVADLEPELRDLVAELFPVEVALPDGTVVPRAKVFVLVGGVLVFGETADRQVRRAFGARHVAEPVLANPAAPKRRQRSTFATTAGPLVATGLTGCGCSSPLKTFTHAAALEHGA